MIDKVQELRRTTGLGMMACKKALEEAGGDVEKAIETLRKKGALKAAERVAERTANEGIVATYLHSNHKIGVIAEISCETDFVAKNEEFVAFGNDVAMHIAAMSPLYIDPSELSKEELEKEREIYIEQMKEEGKPKDMIEKIVEGKLKKYAEEKSLLKQAFVKDPSRTIEEYLAEINNKMGEKVVIGRFERFQIGA